MKKTLILACAFLVSLFSASAFAHAGHNHHHAKHHHVKKFHHVKKHHYHAKKHSRHHIQRKNDHRH